MGYNVSNGVTPAGYGGYEIDGVLGLTTTPQIVTGWTEDHSTGITQSGGRFTYNVAGRYHTVIERIYLNKDKNPLSIVNVTLDIRRNGVSVYTRTIPITAATANDEPGIDAFTTPFIIEVESGDYFEFYVSASDGGATPGDTELAKMAVTAVKVVNI